MRAPLDEQYLTWLYSQIGSARVEDSTRTYWKLLRHLYTKEFVWIIPNDDNRIEDGRDLRYEFIDEMNVRDVSAEWMRLGCSVLELLVALSRKLSFAADGEPRVWFWRLLDNLDISRYTDNLYTRSTHTCVDEIVENLIWRRYNPDGRGGLFPLQHPREDQRTVEIWYQLSAYLLERE